MTKVINLRLARKARARDQAAEVAAQNRARHGEPAALRKARTADAERSVRDLAGKQRDPD
jgi:hypothetical protein